MKGEFNMPSKKQTNKLSISTIVLVIITTLALVSIFVTCVFTVSNGNIVPVNSSVSITDPPVTEPPVPVKEKTVTIGSTGDVLIHKPIYEAAYSSLSGEYDFNNIFTYCSSEIKGCDYFVANLETTLAGT